MRWDKTRQFACSELAVVEWLTTRTPSGGMPEGKIAAKRSYRKGVV